MIAVAATAAVVSLSWTNPPEADLAGVQIFAAADGDTIQGAIYRGRTMDELVPPKIVPGAPETVLFSLPCRSSPRTWAFWVRPFDTSGNVAPPSNVVEVVR